MGRGVPIKVGSWSPEEDAQLAALQKEHGNLWSVIAQQIPGRTGQQCAQRWRHKVNPSIRKEKWTPEEDRLLASLVSKFGTRWAEIARRCNGRTDQQCMGRWRRHLDPSIRRESWTDSEDATLFALQMDHGSQWSLISRDIPGRTAQQCRARFYQIKAAGNDPAESCKDVSRELGKTSPSKKLTSSSMSDHSHQDPLSHAAPPSSQTRATWKRGAAASLAPNEEMRSSKTTKREGATVSCHHEQTAPHRVEVVRPKPMRPVENNSAGRSELMQAERASCFSPPDPMSQATQPSRTLAEGTGAFETPVKDGSVLTNSSPFSGLPLLSSLTPEHLQASILSSPFPLSLGMHKLLSPPTTDVKKYMRLTTPSTISLSPGMPVPRSLRDVLLTPSSIKSSAGLSAFASLAASCSPREVPPWQAWDATTSSPGDAFGRPSKTIFGNTVKRRLSMQLSEADGTVNNDPSKPVDPSEAFLPDEAGASTMAANSVNDGARADTSHLFCSPPRPKDAPLPVPKRYLAHRSSDVVALSRSRLNALLSVE